MKTWFWKYDPLEERPVGDSGRDGGYFLEDDPAGSEVQVADFRTAGRTPRQADGRSGRLQGHGRILLDQPIEHRSLGGQDGVTVIDLGHAPAIKDQLHHRGALGPGPLGRFSHWRRLAGSSGNHVRRIPYRIPAFAQSPSIDCI
jgi:hypothetical protein